MDRACAALPCGTGRRRQRRDRDEKEDSEHRRARRKRAYARDVARLAESFLAIHQHHASMLPKRLLAALDEATRRLHGMSSHGGDHEQRDDAGAAENDGGDNGGSGKSKRQDAGMEADDGEDNEENEMSNMIPACKKVRVEGPDEQWIGEWTSMEQADSEAGFCNQIWKHRQQVHEARAQQGSGMSSVARGVGIHDVLFNKFFVRLRDAALARQPGSLSWDEVRATKVATDMLYNKCCEEFFGGTRDPRWKAAAFLNTLRAVQSIVFGDFYEDGVLEGIL
eukprot:16438314-Heterocapsa_arctica.AAC.1